MQQWLILLDQGSLSLYLGATGLCSMVALSWVVGRTSTWLELIVTLQRSLSLPIVFQCLLDAKESRDQDEKKDNLGLLPRYTIEQLLCNYI